MNAKKAKISVNEFTKIVQERVREICNGHGWKFDNAVHRGLAFQEWVAEVVLEFEPYDTEIEDALLKSNDLGADLVFEDTSRQHFLICQCKFENKQPPSEEDINSFFNKHAHFSDRAWVRKHGSQAARDVLSDYGEKMRSGYSAAYYFVTMANASARQREVADQCTAEYQGRGARVRCELYDFGPLKAYYVRTRSMEASIPDEVRFPIRPKQYFVKNDPMPTIVTLLSGNVLRNMYHEHKESIFAYNIRGYLGSKGINAEILQTLEKRAAEFYYFNNGISAICTDFDISGSELVARKLQVINGAQTLGVIADAGAMPHDIEVLFRLTKTINVSTEKGINRDIIKFNNTQNVVKVSDFRANDPIQVWLEGEFKSAKARGPIPEINYTRKRTLKRRSGGYPLPLELLAKIRYSWLKEPTAVHATPKQLWTLSETPDDKTGLYDVAFGVDGTLVEHWSEPIWSSAVLAIAFYVAIESAAKAKAKKDPTFEYLKRLRFHGVALGAVYANHMLADSAKLNAALSSRAEFDKHWRVFWELAEDVLVDTYTTVVETKDSDTTFFAFVRSEKRWDLMRTRFDRRLSVKK